MSWLRIPLVALQISWPYLLRPWKSPLVRWRIETYGCMDATGRILHADELTPRTMRQFFFRNLQPLSRFLRWAASL